MNKIIKWILIIGSCLVVVILAALFIIPMLLDIQKYKPEIENRISEATGRPFTLGGDLHISLFPLASLSFSDLHLGNPPDFKEKDFLTIKSFEARVKLLPLLFRDIQVKRFVLKGAKIVLVRNKDGRANWESIGKTPGIQEKPAKIKPEKGFPIKSLILGDFSISEGSILWIDHTKRARKEITDISLHLEDVSLDRPIQIAFFASLDGLPISVAGTVGPLGREIGQGTIPLNLSIKAVKELDLTLKGFIKNPSVSPQVDLALDVSAFSPRKLAAAIGQPFPVATSDPKAFHRIALKAGLKGNQQNVSITNGVLDIDDSQMNFSIKVGDFSRPEVIFDLNLDRIDLDRYLPPKTEKKSTGKRNLVEKKKETKTTTPEQKKVDYTLLRRLVLNGFLQIGKLTISNARIQDLTLKISGKNGVFNLNPLKLRMYQGDISARGSLNVKRDIPKSAIELQINKIQIGQLLRDVFQKDFLEGTINAQLSLSMTGDDAGKIKSSLNGQGDLLLKNGAIVGIDLVEMVRNTKSAFLQVLEGKERPRTDFGEMRSSFIITNGVINTPKTILITPAIQVVAAGKADLVKETLDFRVEPQPVAKDMEQEDTQKGSEYLVPLLITGNFSSPKFRPDLKGIAKKQLQEKVLESSEFKKIFKKDELKPLEDAVKGLLKGIFK